MSAYIVIKREVCPECKGSGIIQHPHWEAYWLENQKGLPEMETIEWFAERNWLCYNIRRQAFIDLPPEEIDCRECGGIGKKIKEVDLADALSDLGVGIACPACGTLSTEPEHATSCPLCDLAAS